MTDYISGEISVRNQKLNAVVDAKVGSSRHFHRSYPLPKDTNTETLVAAMSDEGILTITAKRMVCQLRNYLQGDFSNSPHFKCK